MTRFRCDNCDSIVDGVLMLVGENPFAPGRQINGCPYCREVFDGPRLCDVDGCPRNATCGTRTDDGYRHTCGVHIPVKT